jgi:hypothetical protein
MPRSGEVTAMYEHYRARQAYRVVVWGCSIHRTPRGQECTGCADQGELFATSEIYQSAREKQWPPN